MAKWQYQMENLLIDLWQIFPTQQPNRMTDTKMEGLPQVNQKIFHFVLPFGHFSIFFLSFTSWNTSLFKIITSTILALRHCDANRGSWRHAWARREAAWHSKASLIALIPWFQSVYMCNKVHLGIYDAWGVPHCFYNRPKVHIEASLGLWNTCFIIDFTLYAVTL